MSIYKLQKEQQAAISAWQQARKDLETVIAAGGDGKTRRIAFYRDLVDQAKARMLAADDALDQARGEQQSRRGYTGAYTQAMAATVSPW